MTIIALFIWQPQHRLAVYPVGVLMGFTFGAHYGPKSGVYATIIPGGQEALYTAVGMWFGNLFRWIPGVVYGRMVDLSPTQSHRWAFFHLSAYPAIALVVILFVDFKKAEKD